MKKNRLAALAIATLTLVGMTGCVSNGDQQNSTDSAKTSSNSGEITSGNGAIKEFDAFFAVPGTEINENNVVKDLIAEKIGAKCKEVWLTGQTAEEAVGVMIAGGEYPDFIGGSTGHAQLLDAGAYIPIDEYWDNYPNVKNYFTDSEWNTIRDEDGHIYIIPQFGNVYMYDTETVHNDEAFWIQTRVLKWADYPEITTLDEYFTLIEDYLAANPTMEDGTTNIGYEILSDDWRYFCLENPPFFLDGYPNDGCCIVDPVTHKAIDYNTTPTAERYFKKLNEEFNKGIVDPETFTMNYDQYISKVSSGRVLGMVDQYWNFQSAELSIKQQGLDDCTYVPLGIVMDEGVEERYHSATPIDVSNGVGITTSCDDIEGAMKFLDDILSQEIQTLRFWGIAGVDYEVGDDGIFYRTQEQRDVANDQGYINANRCSYAYFPYHKGMNLDGINAENASKQPSEFYEALTSEVQECLDAYGAQTYVQMLNPSGENTDWFPMWSYSNTFTSDTDHGLAKVNMDEVKHEYLPKVVMSEDFDSAWKEYREVYEDRVDVEAYLSALDTEVQRRIDVANGQ